MAEPRSDAPPSGAAARLTGKGKFQTEIRAGGATFLADEPESVGGGDSGPTPFELLSAALAACTAMTLKLYAERKGWELPPFRVEADHAIVRGAGGDRHDRFTRIIAFEAPPPAEWHDKLIEIAEKCPVHRTLMRGFEIVTDIGAPGDHAEGEPAATHEREMERACAE
jgi:putative redox protein